MTYPPQQPGPYGPQDPYGQQNPYGQQQPQQYGQQPQYGGQWGQQPGFPAAPPPKKKTGLIVTLVIVFLLVAGGGFAAWWFLIKDDGGAGGGGGGDDSPRAAADAYVKELGAAVSKSPADATLDKVKPLMCAEDFKALDKELQDAKKEDDASEKPDATTFTVANFEEEGEGATFDMTQKRGDNERDPLKMDVKKEDGNFVVCGLSNPSGGSGSGDGTSGNSEPSSGGGGNGSIPNPIPKSSN
jgi:hypothetical protein